MNEDILKGKWKKLKGEAKIWWADPGSPTSVSILRQRDSSTSPGFCRISKKINSFLKMNYN